MRKLVQAVQVKIPEKCQVKRFRKKGCSVSMAGIRGQRVIIDMDCRELNLPSNKTHCDYIFLGATEQNTDKDWVVPMELKGILDASKVKAQLEAGAQFAEKKLVPTSETVNFLPVVACKKVPPLQHKKLQRLRVKFKNILYEIAPIRCGSKLADVLDHPSTKRNEPV